MIQLAVEENNENLGAKLKVIGVGGAGGNAVNSMINSREIESVEFLAANTDAQALTMSLAQTKIQLGAKITKGLGAGSKPEVGKRAAEEDLDLITEKISQADILFLTAGFGGGTGSGALPVIAKAAKDIGVLTVAVVATPFNFEGKKRLTHAQEAINNLKNAVDTIIIVPNQKLLEQADPKISMLDAFALSDEVLKNAVKGISDIITRAGHINVDFADVKEVMKDMGMAIMGVGRAEGEDRAKKAVLQAIHSPLLEDISINGAKGVLINITGNIDLGLHEINEAATIVHDMVSEDAQIILGSVIDPSMGSQIMVTVIATGFESKKEEYKPAVAAQDKPILVSKEAVKEPQVLFEPKFDKVEKNAENLEENLYAQSFDLNDVDTPTFLRKKAEEDAYRNFSENNDNTNNNKLEL
ncbi:MAG: Cell division protein FtsZ [candidate division TM6 bacterium GW2011_GWF2_28_16]|nr:MAG: Cell division protein FtsZ [candidate division TM6 bacterium GW2011_GWF2_28_16]